MTATGSVVILDRAPAGDDTERAHPDTTANHRRWRRRGREVATEPRFPALGHVPALDGLRGMAMVLVVLSHLWVILPVAQREDFGTGSGLFHSGNLGVIVFLVLGGFLVTSSLLQQRAAGGIGIRRFYVRRLIRVGAPLTVMLTVFLIASWVDDFASTSPRIALDSASAATTYSLNWLLVTRPGQVSPDLGHLWYLSVEQQFYVVWVLALAVLGRRRRLLGGLLIAGTVAVCAWRLAVWSNLGWWEASLRTDTRIDGLLVGSLAALVWASGAGRVPYRRRLAAIGVAVMATLVVLTGRDETIYLGALGIGFALATALAVLGLVLHRSGVASRALQWRVLRSLADVSYPVYLWHLPIFFFFGRNGVTWPLPVRLAVVAALLVAAVAASRRFVERPVAAWLDRRDGLAPPRVRTDRQRFTAAAAWGSVAAAVPFVMVLWDFGLRPLRTAVPTRIFSNFYDLQARALMNGHLDVPRDSLAIEAFRIDGRDYMYFPPFPSILRMPVLALTDSLDGRLTAPSMILAWAVMMTFTALLIWRVRGVLRPGVAFGRREAFATGTLVAVIGGGSVIVFVAALPWVYHEAYMWATAFAVGFTWALIGVLERITVGRVLAAGALALGAILSRTTAGWACCLALVAAAAVLVVHRRWRAERRWAGGVVAAAVVPLAIGATVNWAKFRHPFMFSLDDQVWTSVNAHRREALERNGGGLTGLQFFPTALVNYFRPDGIRFTSVFPFVTLPARPGRPVGGAFLDQTYRTGSVIAFMPLLFGLSVFGLWRTFRRRAGDAASVLRLPVLGALAVAGGVMFYGYLAHRYTSEFVPALIVLSAIGLVELGRWSPTWSPIRRSALTGAFVAVAVFGVVANTAIGLQAARSTSRGTGLQSLVDVRLGLSDLAGRPNADYVEHADDLSGAAPTDHLRVVGDCRAVYLSSGDLYEPWIPVDIRGVTADVTVTGVGAPGRIPLVAFDGATGRSVEVEHDGYGSYRLLVEGGGSEASSDWYLLEPGTTFNVTVRASLDDSTYLVDSPAFLYTGTPLSDWNATWSSVPSQLRIDTPSARLQAARGARVDIGWLPPSDRCRRLVE